MLAFLTRSGTIWLLCHKKYLLYVGKDIQAQYYLLFIEWKGQIPPASYDYLEKIPSKDFWCLLPKLSFSLPITPEVTLNGYQANSTNKKTKLEVLICFQSWRSTHAKDTSSFLPLSFWKTIKLGPHWDFLTNTLLLCNKHTQEGLAQFKQNESSGEGESCSEGQAALPCQKWGISLIYCAKERQKGRRDPLIKCSPFEPCLICWLITSVRSCNKQRPFQTMMPICYGSTSVLELPAATLG